MKKRLLCLLLLCALLLPSMPALAISVNEAPSEEEMLETVDKGFVQDTKIYSNNFQSGSFGGTSSGTVDKWNRAYQMSNSVVIDPKDPENYVGCITATNNNALTKTYLTSDTDLFISVSLYIPAFDGYYTPQAYIELGKQKPLVLNYDATNGCYNYTFGTQTGSVPTDSWMTFSVYLTQDAELGWDNANWFMQFSGELTTANGASVSYLQENVQMKYGNDACNMGFKTENAQKTGYYIDEFYAYIPEEFGDNTVTLPSANDGLGNVLLDDKLDIVFYHHLDLATVDLSAIRILNVLGEEVPYTSVRFDPNRSKYMTITLEGNPLSTFSEFYIDFGDIKDVTGQSPKKEYTYFETFGRVGQRPLADELIMPPEGGYVMPDEYNTGFRCDESELVDFTEKYGVSPSNSTIIITESIARKFNYEFSHFKTSYGIKVTASSPVYMHDFKLDMFIEGQEPKSTTHYGIINDGSQMLYVSYATCRGSGSSMFNGSRLHVSYSYAYDIPADHIKGASYQTFVSCYLRDGGYMSPLAHADVNQTSMFNAETSMTKSMFMVGCRVDVPNYPGVVSNSAAIFLAPERVGSFGFANYQLSHNWFNGSAITIRLGHGSHAAGLFTHITYAYNRMGYGEQYGTYTGNLAEEELANYGNGRCDSIEVGSVVYYDEGGNRVYSIEDMTESGTVLVSLSNYTKVARNYSVSVVLEDASGNAVAVFDKENSISRYIPFSEYATGSPSTGFKLVNGVPDQPIDEKEEIALTGLPEDLTGYTLKVVVNEITAQSSVLLRTSTLNENGTADVNGSYKKSYLVALESGATGEVIRYVEVYEGETVPEEAIPPVPEVPGYTFLGWSSDFTAPITEDTTIKALYESNGVAVHTVKFVGHDGKVLRVLSVEHGKGLTAPVTPPVTDYTFYGWSADFSAVTEDMTVKALYKQNGADAPETFTVTFLGKGGEVLKTETVAAGSAATAPTAPAVDGFTFSGWSVDFSSVTSDLTVRAQYTENTPTPEPDPDPTPDPDPAVDPAIAKFEAKVAALANVENASLSAKYNALYEAAVAFADIVDKDAAQGSQAYADFVAFVASYNAQASIVSFDIVKGKK